MQSQPDKQFKFTINYRDHVKKFVQFRPLQTKCADADQVVYIFLTFGAPVLQTTEENLSTAKFTYLKIL